MFKKELVIVAGLVSLFMFVGCAGSTGASVGPPVGYDNAPPVDATWISPAKVMVSNFHAGGRAEYNLTIHNGRLAPTGFNIYYRYPDHVGDGYEKAPASVQEWVIIVDSSIVLQGRETQDVLVVLDMPVDAVVEPKKWEFWVAVMETNQSGLVKTEMATRWLVSMR